MLNLYLLRHAKAESSSLSGDDYDKVLSPDGRARAIRIGTRFKREGFLPKRVFSSPAARAKESAELWAAAAAYTGLIEYRDELYASAASIYLRLLHSVSGAEPVLIVGHNPEIEKVASRFIGSPLSLGTGEAACLQISADRWGDLNFGVYARLETLFQN